MKKQLGSLAAAALTLMLAQRAEAHVSIVSGSAVANATQIVTFGVGHGCSGADTYRLQIEVPAGVTSVRPMTSDFGRATVQSSAAGVVTSVTWQRADADVLPADTSYYEVRLRLRTPNTPFASVSFVAHQTCRAADGTMTTVDWAGRPGDTMAEPAPVLSLLPARSPGWNRYTIPAAITDLSAFFSDALIVWKGTAAYSANANTVQLITGTSGVTALTALAANDEVWVRY